MDLASLCNDHSDGDSLGAESFSLEESLKEEGIFPPSLMKNKLSKKAKEIVKFLVKEEDIKLIFDSFGKAERERKSH